jgi:hypothetical protein
MKAYRVFHNGLRCASQNIPTWDIDTFSTKRAAEIFMWLWAFPWDRKSAEAAVGQYPTQTNTPRHMYDGYVNAIMVIVEIEEQAANVDFTSFV